MKTGSNWWNIIGGRKRAREENIRFEKEVERMSDKEKIEMIKFIEKKRDKSVNEEIILHILKKKKGD